MRTEVGDEGAGAGPAGGTTAGGSDREIVITRRIEAPRAIEGGRHTLGRLATYLGAS